MPGKRRWAEAPDLIQLYFDKFGSKPCCFSDLETFMNAFSLYPKAVEAVVSEKIRNKMIAYLQRMAVDRCTTISGDEKGLVGPAEAYVKHVRKCTCSHQLQRAVGVHRQVTATVGGDGVKQLITNLVREYIFSQKVHNFCKLSCGMQT